MFLYSTVSTLKPIVGIVVTTSQSFSLYKIVVLPTASKPTMRIHISCLPNMRCQMPEKASPMVGSEGTELAGVPPQAQRATSSPR
ncbi:hypothetical protein N9L19_01165 [bacterium]|nr:hypothetical protein [bacterium]